MNRNEIKMTDSMSLKQKILIEDIKSLMLKKYIYKNFNPKSFNEKFKQKVDKELRSIDKQISEKSFLLIVDSLENVEEDFCKQIATFYHKSFINMENDKLKHGNLWNYFNESFIRIYNKITRNIKHSWGW